MNRFENSLSLLTIRFLRLMTLRLLLLLLLLCSVVRFADESAAHVADAVERGSGVESATAAAVREGNPASGRSSSESTAPADIASSRQ